VEKEQLLSKANLSKIKSYDQFFEVRQAVASIGNEKLFEILFPSALLYDQGGASEVAAMLLIEFDPKASRTCQQLLLEIADSKWYLSDQYIPFYLVTQFGKWNLLGEISQLVSSNKLKHEQSTRIDTIRYWAEMPPAHLSSGFTYFEWREAIEGKNA